MQVRPMRPRLNGNGILPESNTTEFWLLILVLIEVGLLIVLRRWAVSIRGHGG